MKNVKKFFLLSCAIYCTACSGMVILEIRMGRIFRKLMIHN